MTSEAIDCEWFHALEITNVITYAYDNFRWTMLEKLNQIISHGINETVAKNCNTAVEHKDIWKYIMESYE